MTAAVLCAPYNIEANSHPSPMASASNPQSCKGTILVMDDAPVMQTTFSYMLQRLGYASVCTNEGAEALRLYQQAQHEGNPFTGVILDLHNHLGKGGLETMMDLQEFDPQANVVLCSGDVHALAMSQFQAYGFRSALMKPFGLEDLDNILHCIR